MHNRRGQNKYGNNIRNGKTNLAFQENAIAERWENEDELGEEENRGGSRRRNRQKF